MLQKNLQRKHLYLRIIQALIVLLLFLSLGNFMQASLAAPVEQPGNGPALAGFAQVSAPAVALPTLTKTIVDTGEDTTLGYEVSIGEVITYEVLLEIPEGTTNSAVLTDLLTEGLVIQECVEIVAPPELTTDLTNGFDDACNDPTNPTVTNSGRNVTFTLGNITNSDVDPLTAEVLEITYRAIVLNSAYNLRGASNGNEATFSWDNGTPESVNSSAPDLAVVEPTLAIDKSANPYLVDPGDEVTFTLVISHTPDSDSSAFELVLSDAVPSGLTYVPGSLMHVAGVAPIVLDDNFLPGLTARWQKLLLGETSTIQYKATVDVPGTPGQVISNTASMTWTSLPGFINQSQSAYSPYAVERTGDPTQTGGALNNYKTTGSANVTILDLNPQKVIVATSESASSESGLPRRVLVGEIVRYQATIQLPHGPAPNVMFKDLLPPGMQFLDDGTAKVAFVANGAGITSNTLDVGLPGCSGLNITGSSPATPTCPLPDEAVSTQATSDDDTYGDGVAVYFKFGDLENLDSDSDFEYVVVEFNALVLNALSNQAFDNASGTAATPQATVLSNQFQVLLDANTQPSATSPVTTANQVQIAESLISDVSKSVLTAPVDAGDTVIYRLTFSNNAAGDDAAPAFEVSLTDLLDSNLVYQSLSIIAPGEAVVTNNSSGNTIDLLFSQLNPGSMVTVDITAKVANTTPAGQSIPNQGQVTYTSLPGTNGTVSNPTGSANTGASGSPTGERDGSGGSGTLNDYRDNSSVNLNLGTPTVTKLAPSPLTYTIGDLVTFTIKATLTEGVTEDLVIFDDLPAGLAYRSYEVVTSAAASGGLLAADFNGTLPAPLLSTSGGDVSLTFGDSTTTADNVSNNNAFLVKITVQVLNIESNQQGSVLANSAALKYTNPNNAQTVTVATPAVEISLIEAQITTTKDVAPLGGVQAGSVLTYTVRFTNTGTSGNATAYQVSAEDTLAQGTAFTALTACLDQGGSSVATTVTDLGTSIQFGQWDILAGNYVECTYTVTAQNSLYVDGTHTNTIDADWTSLSSIGDPQERIYNDTPGIAVDGDQDTDQAQFSVGGLTFAKSDNGKTQVKLGEVVNYTLTFTSPLGTIRDLLVKDVLPAGMQVDSGSILVNGVSSAFNASVSLPNNGTVPVTLTIDFDDAVVVSSPVTIQYSAAFFNQLSYKGGDVLTNNASQDHDDAAGSPAATLSDSDSMTILMPDLGITKSDGNSIALPGDLLVYDLVVTNNGNVATQGVTITDKVPENTTFNAANSSVGWSGCADGAVGGTTCTYTVGSLDVGQSATVQFAVDVLNNIPDAVVRITNTATVADDGSFGQDPTPDNNTAEDVNTLGGGKIGDLVWDDLNGNGIQDTGEPGIGGVTINLYWYGLDGLPGNADDDSKTILTAGNGTYQFANLPNGKYVIEVIPPSGYAYSPWKQGADVGKDSNINPATGSSEVVTLAIDEVNLTIDAGFSNDHASIGNYTWRDLDNDGIQYMGEPAVTQVTVKLYKSDQTLVATTQTDSQGLYALAGITPGDYYLQFEYNGEPFTLQKQGSDTAKDSNPDSSGKTDVFSLLGGQIDHGIDAGLEALPILMEYVVKEALDAQVTLEWSTNQEVELVGFNLYRSTDPDNASGGWVKLNAALIPATGPGVYAGNTYQYVDSDLTPGLTYYYKLELVKVGDVTLEGGIVQVTPGGYRQNLPLMKRNAP